MFDKDVLYVKVEFALKAILEIINKEFHEKN